jgi:hypothetical protein
VAPHCNMSREFFFQSVRLHICTPISVLLFSTLVTDGTEMPIGQPAPFIFLKYNSRLLHGVVQPVINCWLQNMTRSSLFWDVTQRKVVVSYRRLGTTCRSHLQRSWTAWPLKMEEIVCPETSVTKYQCTLLKIPKEGKSHLHRARSLKSANYDDLTIAKLSTSFSALLLETVLVVINLYYYYDPP